VQAVTYWRKHYSSLLINQAKRTSIEMGLVGVLATQLWHHTFVEAALCELPGIELRKPQAVQAVA